LKLIYRIFGWLKGGALIAIGSAGIGGALFDVWIVATERIHTGTWHWKLFYETLPVSRSQFPSFLLPIVGLPADLLYIAVGIGLVWQGLE
jgi:hypothetical protein